MIEAASEWLDNRGCVADAPRKPGDLHTERYWSLAGRGGQVPTALAAVAAEPAGVTAGSQ